MNKILQVKYYAEKYYAQNADKEIRQWMEEKRHCALKMMASAPLASGAQYVANTNTILQIQIQIPKNCIDVCK